MMCMMFMKCFCHRIDSHRSIAAKGYAANGTKPAEAVTAAEKAGVGYGPGTSRG